MPSEKDAQLSEAFLDWMAALEARHLADLRVADVTRALRALSSAYIERRRTASARLRDQQVRGALDGAGKRAAFALFYGPLHFLTTDHIVRALGADAPGMTGVLDIGCGTGAAGAAWALAAGGVPVSGLDRNRWAIQEAAWTYRSLGLRAKSTLGDVTRLRPMKPRQAALAAFVLNELSDPAREKAERWLRGAANRGARVLVIEPIARSLTPWWDDAARAAVEAGGRADEWRFRAARPPLLQLLDKAAGLDHRELTARSLYYPEH